jgi:rhodanese-related sulfurtransferase
MRLVDAIKKTLGLTGQAAGAPQDRTHVVQEETTATAFTVPEVTSSELLAQQKNGTARPLLLDVRENFERAQALIPGSLHIPMNSLPYRLEELDPAQDIIVYCAHGNRSHGVAGWLIQQGYTARSLKGGIVAWQHAHGPIERGYTVRS